MRFTQTLRESADEVCGSMAGIGKTLLSVPAILRRIAHALEIIASQGRREFPAENFNCDKCGSPYTESFQPSKDNKYREDMCFACGSYEIFEIGKAEAGQ